MMEGLKMSRRDFSKSAVLGTVSLALSAGPAVRNVLGANDRIGVGLIGSGNQGRYDLGSFIKTNQVDVVALCDVWDVRLSETLVALNLSSEKVKSYKDFRKLLENKDIDAVIVATPEHWHAIPMIAACEAGKDVYVEKPISHTILEGRRMVEAANKNNRVVQCGTQQRSGEHFQKVAELLRSGRIGRVTEADTWVLRGTSVQSRMQTLLPRYRPAGGSRLGQLAGSGALSPLQPQPPYGMGWLLGDWRRRVDELGASPDRYRSLGAGGRRPADGGGFRRAVDFLRSF